MQEKYGNVLRRLIWNILDFIMQLKHHQTMHNLSYVIELESLDANIHSLSSVIVIITFIVDVLSCIDLYLHTALL